MVSYVIPITHDSQLIIEVKSTLPTGDIVWAHDDVKNLLSDIAEVIVSVFYLELHLPIC